MRQGLERNTVIPCGVTVKRSYKQSNLNLKDFSKVSGIEINTQKSIAVV